MGLPALVSLPFTELQQWAVDAEARGIWPARRRDAFPLSEFPDSHLARIRYEVEADWKPPFWLDLGLAQLPSRSWLEWHWQRGIDPDAIRPAIPKRLRAAVLARDGLMCQICLTPVAPDDVHLDHIKPWSKGGETTLSNLRVAHSLCNIRKGAKEE